MSKFSDEIAELLHSISKYGTDEEKGSVYEYPFLWAGLLLGVKELDGHSFIVTEDDQGFVDYEEFDTEKKAIVSFEEYEDISGEEE